MSLVSCIEGDEEITIREDGSAHLKMRYQVPGMIFSAKDSKELVGIIDRELGKKDHLKLLVNRVESRDGQRIVQIELETDPEFDLDGGLFKKEKSSGAVEEDGKSDKLLRALVGDLEAKVDGLSVGVVRKVNLDPLLQEYMGKNSGSMLGDSQFRYTVHLPEAAEQSNAHEVSDGGKTLKWVYWLRESKQKPIMMSVVAPIPLPWWIYGVGGGVLCFSVIGGYGVVRKLRKKRVA
jgi:hypothetical protein